jgi:hypothetical protein
MTRDATTSTAGREALCIESGFVDCAPGPGGGVAIGFDPIGPGWGALPAPAPAPTSSFDPSSGVAIDLGGGTDDGTDGITPARFKFTKAKCLCSGGPQCSSIGNGGVVVVDVGPPNNHDACTAAAKVACAACTSAGCSSTSKGCN